MYGFYYHFNNLHVRNSHRKYSYSDAWCVFHLKPVVLWFVSSEVLNCRLLKSLLDHPMKY